jgi:hypothetical protein
MTWRIFLLIFKYKINVKCQEKTFNLVKVYTDLKPFLESQMVEESKGVPRAYNMSLFQDN